MIDAIEHVDELRNNREVIKNVRIRTIQNNVSFANPEYSSIVDRTLNIRHTNTTMNL